MSRDLYLEGLMILTAVHFWSKEYNVWKHYHPMWMNFKLRNPEVAQKIENKLQERLK